MTNIQAPATEGSSSYSSYKAGEMLHTGFAFEIPVYNNMPAYTSLPGAGNTNNNLSSLSIEGYSLSPTFDADVITYNVYVPTDTEKVNITATPESSTSKVEGTGEIVLEENEMDVTITVTSEAGTEKKYVIAIKKIDDTITPNEAIEASNIPLSGETLTNIKNGTTVIDLKNLLISNGAKEVAITKDGNVLNDGDVLSTSTKVVITTAIETKEYVLSVKGDTSSDGQITILDLLQVLKHINGDKVLSGAARESADTSGDGDVTILDLLQVLKHVNGDKLL